MVAVVDAVDPAQSLALLRAHPELATSAPLTSASAAEQGGKGLDRLSGEQAARLAERNAAYREKFGFPFIIAVRGQRDVAMILDSVEQRLYNSPEKEFRAALGEVAKIARFRLDDQLDVERK
jgi:2-oxo-4-hydroxy-4-carboxy-5-ureidoimidazoline decarboxylase